MRSTHCNVARRLSRRCAGDRFRRRTTRRCDHLGSTDAAARPPHLGRATGSGAAAKHIKAADSKSHDSVRVRGTFTRLLSACQAPRREQGAALFVSFPSILRGNVKGSPMPTPGNVVETLLAERERRWRMRPTLDIGRMAGPIRGIARRSRGRREPDLSGVLPPRRGRGKAVARRISWHFPGYSRRLKMQFQLRAAISALAKTVSSKRSPGDPRRSPFRVGRYELRKLLGRGDSTSTYKATDRRRGREPSSKSMTSIETFDSTLSARCERGFDSLPAFATRICSESTAWACARGIHMSSWTSFAACRLRVGLTVLRCSRRCVGPRRSPGKCPERWRNCTKPGRFTAGSKRSTSC